MLLVERARSNRAGRERLTNDEWLQRLSSKDPAEREAASVTLRELMIRNLRAQFRKRGLSQDCVEDVVQETILRVLDRLSTFRGESRFTSWATAVGVRTGMELIRKQYWKTQTLGDLVKGDDVELAGPWESSEPNPETNSARSEVLKALSVAIQSALSERQRLALMAELKGMPMSEIASELGSSRGAIYKLTHDARKKLKAALQQQGFDADTIYDSLTQSEAL